MHDLKHGRKHELKQDLKHDPDPERKYARPHDLDTATVQACLATVHGFFDGLDVRDHARAQSFFTADGQWERGGATLTGPQRIGEALAQRPDARRTFHAVCNPVLERLDEDTVVVRFYLLAYDAVSGQATPLQPAGIRRCEDRLRREQGVWRIQRKSSTAHLPLPGAT